MHHALVVDGRPPRLIDNKAEIALVIEEARARVVRPRAGGESPSN